MTVGPPAPFPAPPPSPPWPRWLIALLAAFGGLLLGAVGGGVAGVAFGPDIRGRDYEIVVSLEREVTEQQKTEIRAAVDRATPGEVTLRTREDNFARFKKQNEDDPELVRSVGPEAFGETIVYRTKGVDPDCGPVRSLGKLDGVDDVLVHMLKDGDHPEGALLCPK